MTLPGDLARVGVISAVCMLGMQSDPSLILKTCSDKVPTPHSAAQDYAARTVQKAFRDWREMRIHFVKGMNWRTTMNAEDDAKVVHTQKTR